MMWIHSLDEKVSKRIKKTDPIPEGWFKGRKNEILTTRHSSEGRARTF